MSLRGTSRRAESDPTEHDAGTADPVAPVTAADVTVEPVGPEDFPYVEDLFGPSGACSGCWCMWPRLTGSEFTRRSGDGTKAMLQDLIEAGRRPGLLAFRGDRPVGWIAVAPRPEYGRVLRSPLLRGHLSATGAGGRDDNGVWSVTCFFVRRGERASGLSDTLLAAGRDHSVAAGAHTVEGYPIDPTASSRPDELFHGTPGVFERVGFRQVARLSTRRTLWRHEARTEARAPG